MHAIPLIAYEFAKHIYATTNYIIPGILLSYAKSLTIFYLLSCRTIVSEDKPKQSGGELTLN